MAREETAQKNGGAASVSTVDPVIEKALADLGAHAARREKVFAVAAIWHRHHGTLPTIQVTRNYVGRGSYTDIGHDLKDFGATVAAQQERLIQAPGMPEDLGIQVNDLVGQLWLAATTQAAQAFAVERAELQAHRDRLAANNATLATERAQALQDRSDAMGALAAEQGKVASLKASVTGLEESVSELESRFNATIAEHAVEVQKLQSDLIAANRLIEAKDVAVVQLREQLNETKDKLGAERDLAEAFRLQQLARAKEAQDQLAALGTALTVANAQKADLEGRLVGAHAKADQMAQDLVNGSVAVQACQSRLEEANRDLVAAKTAAKDARDAEQIARDVAAELKGKLAVLEGRKV